MRSRGDRLANRFRRLRFHILEQAHTDVGRKGDIEFTGLEGEHARRQAVDDSESDFIQIRAVFFPVVGIADETDRFSALELDEFERTGANRPGAHRRLRNVAGIYGRKSAGEQHGQARLRLAQFERGLVVAIDRDVLELRVPDLARVAAEIVNVALADQHPPGALHVPGSEWLAVVPLHALPQFESQFGIGRIPGPAFSQIRDDRLEALVDLGGIENHQVVEHRRKRRHRGDCRFLEQ